MRHLSKPRTRSALLLSSPDSLQRTSTFVEAGSETASGKWSERLSSKGASSPATLPLQTSRYFLLAYGNFFRTRSGCGSRFGSHFASSTDVSLRAAGKRPKDIMCKERASKFRNRARIAEEKNQKKQRSSIEKRRSADFERLERCYSN